MEVVVESKEKNTFNYASISNGVHAIDFDSMIKINSRYDLTTIENALKNKDIPKLVEVSNYFYLTSGEYRRMVHSLSDTHTFQYIYAPMLITNKKINYDKTYFDVTNYLANYDVEFSNRYITFSVILNGIFYGYERVFDDVVVLQELPPQYCRTTYKINGLNVIDFDYKFFDSLKNEQERLSMFEQLPDEFLQGYNDYKANKPLEDGRTKDLNWRPLDINFTRCHYLTEDKSPFFSAIFTDIIALQEYKEIDKAKSKLDIYRLIVQKLPIDKEGEPLLDEIQAQQIHQNTKRMIGADQQVDVLSTPCEISSVDLSNKGERSQDIIANGLANIYNSAGISQTLYNSGATGTIGLTTSLKNDEALLSGLIRDYERHYNYRLKTIGKAKSNFFVKDLGVTIYNESEKVSQFQQQATLGGSKFPFLVASTGLRQYEVMSMVMFESDLDLQSLLIPLASSFNGGTEQTQDKGGRPEKKESELSEEGLKTKNDDKNNKRAKK